MTEPAKLPEQPSVSQEQQRLLASVAAVDKELDVDLSAPGAPGSGAAVNGVPAEIEDPVAENAAMFQTVVDILTPLLPFLPEVYSPKVIKQIAVAFTKVEQKRGWNIAGKLPPEVALAFVTIPPTVQAFMLGQMYIEKMKAEASAAAQGAASDGNS